MTGFSAEWLAVREPIDAAARDRCLAERLAGLLEADAPARIFDLGAGTGANMRYLAPLLAVPQQWVLLDRDDRLLERARELATTSLHERPLVSSFHTQRIDLAGSLEALVLDGRSVVTASALLDLVSADWLRTLLQRCCACNARVLFALSYDGRIDLDPRDPDDAAICALVNRHQATDKGFGPALGPAAAAFACAHLQALSYQVQSARSDWVLDPSQVRVQEWLLRGWAQAAMEMAPAEQDRCERWLGARLGHLQRGRSAMRVGHQDVIGWPFRRCAAPGRLPRVPT